MEDKIQDYDYWLKEVKEYAWNLAKVPKELIDYNMCLIAITKRCDAIEFVPKKLQTYEFYLKLVKAEGCYLVEVPTKFKTYELCKAAVEQDSNALYNVPKKYLEIKKDYKEGE